MDEATIKAIAIANGHPIPDDYVEQVKYALDHGVKRPEPVEDEGSTPD